MVIAHQLQVERGTGKFARQRPTFYHCATQPTQLRIRTTAKKQTQQLLSCAMNDYNERDTTPEIYRRWEGRGEGGGPWFRPSSWRAV